MKRRIRMMMVMRRRWRLWRSMMTKSRRKGRGRVRKRASVTQVPIDSGEAIINRPVMLDKAAEMKAEAADWRAEATRLNKMAALMEEIVHLGEEAASSNEDVCKPKRTVQGTPEKSPMRRLMEQFLG